jgi:hypothetical protein
MRVPGGAIRSPMRFLPSHRRSPLRPIPHSLTRLEATRPARPVWVDWARALFPTPQTRDWADRNCLALCRGAPSCRRPLFGRRRFLGGGRDWDFAVLPMGDREHGLWASDAGLEGSHMDAEIAGEKSFFLLVWRGKQRQTRAKSGRPTLVPVRAC